MDYANFITIAADDVSRLRKCDVYRVLDECPTEHRERLAGWIKRSRPGLRAEVDACLLEVK